MHVTFITSHSWHRLLLLTTIDQLPEPVKQMFGFGPHERASHCRLRHWTVCGRELKVIMNNSEHNVYKNTVSPPTTEPHRHHHQLECCIQPDILSNPHSWFCNNLPPPPRIHRLLVREYYDGEKKTSLVLNRIHKNLRIPFTSSWLFMSKYKEDKEI